MLSEKILEVLNKQINLEHYSSNLYMSAGSWCMANGYEGAGAFLMGHAKEETMHMSKLFDYIIETGSQALIGSIDAPKQQWDSLKEVFIDTLEHEKLITNSINDLVALCFENKDFSTFNFLQWYVAEQHEEEALFKGIIDKFNLAGEDNRGLFLVDREIATIQSSEV